MLNVSLMRHAFNVVSSRKYYYSLTDILLKKFGLISKILSSSRERSVFIIVFIKLITN